MSWSTSVPLLLLVLAVEAQAVIRFVDGGCANNGNGTAVSPCAASPGGAGPFNTIEAGVLAMVASTGDHLNIRGAHDAFDGIYFEALTLSGTAGLPGQSLNCAAGNRCVIQGCRVVDGCPADEVPILRGMRLRADWSSVFGTGAGEVFSRTMEATPAESGSSQIRNAFDPGHLVEGTAYPLAMMPYGGDNQSASVVVDGRWSFQTGSNTILVNPTGSGVPANTIYVPHFMWNFWIENPSANVTLAYITAEGSRMRSLLATGTGSQPVANIFMLHLTQRYIRRFFNHTGNAPGFVVEDGLVEYGGRGSSFYPNPGTPGDGVYGYRLFGVHGGAIRRTIIRHLGSDGTTRMGGGQERAAPWLDSPWNQRNGTAIAATGEGIQIKQTEGFTVEDNQAEDLSWPAYLCDVSHNMTIQRNTARRVRAAVVISNQTDVSAPFLHCGNVIVRNNTFDEVGYKDMLSPAILVSNGSEADAGVTFLAQIYNNFISHIGFACIAVQSDTATPTANVSIWHNTCYEDRVLAGDPGNGIPAASAGRGLLVRHAVSNFVAANNVYDSLNDDDILLSNAVCGASSCTGFVTNGDVIGTAGTCQVDWNTAVWTTSATNPSSGTCGTLTAFNAAIPSQETTRTNGALNFVDPMLVPPNLHLGTGSAAINTGVTVSQVVTDIDGDARPQSTFWDPGADEVTGTPPTTVTTTTTTTTSTTSTTTTTLVGATTTTTSTTSSTTETTTSTTSTTTATTLGGVIETMGVDLQGVDF